MRNILATSNGPNCRGLASLTDHGEVLQAPSQRQRHDSHIPYGAPNHRLGYLVVVDLRHEEIPEQFEKHRTHSKLERLPSASPAIPPLVYVTYPGCCCTARCRKVHHQYAHYGRQRIGHSSLYRPVEGSMQAYPDHCHSWWCDGWSTDRLTEIASSEGAILLEYLAPASSCQAQVHFER